MGGGDGMDGQNGTLFWEFLTQDTFMGGIFCPPSFFVLVCSSGGGLIGREVFFLAQYDALQNGSLGWVDLVRSQALGRRNMGNMV